MYESNVAEGYARIWEEMAVAVKNRRHGFHTFTLATIDADGLPQARTMVLRGTDPERRTIQFNCDARSSKVPELRENPTACAVLYSVEEKLQVRASGTVTIHHHDAVTEETWREMQPMSRDSYRTPFAPGSKRREEDRDRATLPLSDAHENLVVCDLTVSILEWLSLSSDGHERARCEWKSDGTLLSRWLHP
ncbi:MAG: pyridoxamine 5'-phosphate oxidase family protein [Fibrella sp.]|nr:pyridoxamine 5'-phosphate oxidase family protein [Armatimonadota bacterium]